MNHAFHLSHTCQLQNGTNKGTFSIMEINNSLFRKPQTRVKFAQYLENFGIVCNSSNYTISPISNRILKCLNMCICNISNINKSIYSIRECLSSCTKEGVNKLINSIMWNDVARESKFQ